mgnify:CR=1 FL=1
MLKDLLLSLDSSIKSSRLMLLNLSVIVMVLRLGPLTLTGVVSFLSTLDDPPEMILLSFFHSY